MVEQGIKFVRPPAEQDYGTVAVFEDLYGNLWDLLEMSQATQWRRVHRLKFIDIKSVFLGARFVSGVCFSHLFLLFPFRFTLPISLILKMRMIFKSI